MPWGELNDANVPVPSAAPLEPEPAKVVTTPVAITILRTFLFWDSTTYRLLPSVVIPRGLLNDADVPVPSVNPALAEPAKDVTAPVRLSGVPCIAPPISVPAVCPPEVLLPPVPVPDQVPLADTPASEHVNVPEAELVGLTENCPEKVHTPPA